MTSDEKLKKYVYDIVRHWDSYPDGSMDTDTAVKEIVFEIKKAREEARKKILNELDLEFKKKSMDGSILIHKWTHVWNYVIEKLKGEGKSE